MHDACSVHYTNITPIPIQVNLNLTDTCLKILTDSDTEYWYWKILVSVSVQHLQKFVARLFSIGHILGTKVFILCENCLSLACYLSVRYQFREENRSQH